MPLRRLRSGKIPPNFVPGKIAEGLFWNPTKTTTFVYVFPPLCYNR
jgi:hypothetical protein